MNIGCPGLAAKVHSGNIVRVVIELLKISQFDFTLPKYDPAFYLYEVVPTRILLLYFRAYRFSVSNLTVSFTPLSSLS